MATQPGIETHARGSGESRPWGERLTTATIFFVNGLGIGGWAAAIPSLKLELALSEGALSLALLSFALGALVAMPAAGFIGARVSTGAASWAAALAFVLALLLPDLAPSLPLLCLAAVVVGIANGAVDVLMNAHASQVERRWGKPIMSSFHAAFSLGGAAGAVLGGWAATMSQGSASWGSGLWAPTLLGGVLVLACLGSLRQGAAEPASTSLALPSRTLIPIAFLALLCMMVEGAIADWSGTYLTQHGATPGLAATGYAAFSAAMIAGRLVGDRVVARLGVAATVRAGGLVAAAGLALAVAMPGIVPAGIGFGLVGLGLANTVPALFSAAGRAAQSPSAGVAAAATAGYTGFLVGPVIIGAVASLSELRWGMALLAVMALAVAASSAAHQFRR